MQCEMVHTHVKGENGADEMQSSSPDGCRVLGHDAGADERHHDHSHKGCEGGRSLDRPWELLVQTGSAEHRKHHHLSSPSAQRASYPEGKQVEPFSHSLRAAFWRD